MINDPDNHHHRFISLDGYNYSLAGGYFHEFVPKIVGADLRVRPDMNF